MLVNSNRMAYSTWQRLGSFALLLTVQARLAYARVEVSQSARKYIKMKDLVTISGVT